MIRRLGLATATLAAGYAVAGGLFWALVNVPESNVPALALSAALVVVTLSAVGVFTAASAALGDGLRVGDAARRAIGSLPAFFVGLLIFAILWWLTGFAETWWRAHNGEIDATLIRYAGITRTQPLHRAFFWTTWAMRWVLGLSAIAAPVTTATTATTATVGGLQSIPTGVRHTVRLVTLAAIAVAVALVRGGLWRVVYWRPARMTPWLEPTFVAAKLAVLYWLAAAIVCGALVICRRTARSI